MSGPSLSPHGKLSQAQRSTGPHIQNKTAGGLGWTAGVVDQAACLKPQAQ
jgi:hypothetical protein